MLIYCYGLFNFVGETSTAIKITNSLREPYTYPLFFTNGERGWGTDNRLINNDGNKVRFPAYLTARFLKCEHEMYATRLLNNLFTMQTNRFVSMAHLGQMYCVDSISTMIDSQLKFTRDNQDVITGGHRSGVQIEDNGT